MKTGNSRKIEEWDTDAQVINRIIYIDEHRQARPRKKKKNSDTLWNVIFAVACLSVIVVLFLH